MGFVTFGDNSSTVIPQATIEGTFTSRAEIEIIDDNRLEDEENFNVFLLPSMRFSTVTGGPDVLTATILDNEGIVRFVWLQDRAVLCTIQSSVLSILTNLITAATVRFNPVEYSGVEGDGELMVCVDILTTADSSQYDVIATLNTVDGIKTGESSVCKKPSNGSITNDCGLDEV